jgi:esterase/lipase superfamily enzyme
LPAHLPTISELRTAEREHVRPFFLHIIASSTEGARSCDIHLATGCNPWEVPGPTHRMSEVLASRGIAHHLDDWGPEGGHEWPYWHHQMWEYVGAHF